MAFTHPGKNIKAIKDSEQGFERIAIPSAIGTLHLCLDSMPNHALCFLTKLHNKTY